VKTHYEILGLEPAADAGAIKKAFRREIARYHPDKVVHLGEEFQEMAATRAAELTVAYTTLTDEALRAEYDASITGGQPHIPQPPRAAPVDVPVPSRGFEGIQQPAPTQAGATGRFASERADRDVILKRAVAGRVLSIVERLYGELETPSVRGFDLAIVPLARPRFLGAPPPRVLVRILDRIDGAAITDAHGAASRARLHSGKSPIIVLLFARHLASPVEIAKANDATARSQKVSGGPEEVAVVAVDIADWSCRLAPNCSTAVHKLTGEIRA
jgi:hypothetical protein